MLQQVGCVSLQERRMVLRLCMFYKIHKGGPGHTGTFAH